MDQSGKKQKKVRKPSSSSMRVVGASTISSQGATATATVAPSKSFVSAAGGSTGCLGSSAPPNGSGTTGVLPAPAFCSTTSVGGYFGQDLSPNSSEWLNPPGGFLKSLQMPYQFVNYPSTSQIPENFHFVGARSSTFTTSPTGSGPPVEAAHIQGEQTIDIEDNDSPEPARTDKRLNWSHEEHIRLVSAWLQNSLDPVDGNGKKSDQYWADVTDMYNSTTASNRRRNRNQLKIRWDRIKKPLSDFHGCWIRNTRVYQSGMSDDQRTDQALQMYASEHGDKPFLLQHIWKIVKNERKWAAYVKKMDKEKSAMANPTNVVAVEDSPKKRPIGTKQAKALRDGKRKSPEAISAIGEKLDKFIEASSKAEKMAEKQESLANKKLEIAKEQTKGKMLDLYKDLLCGSTIDLSEEAKAERSKALESMRLALFAKEY